MSALSDQALIRNLTDEEFMREAYIRGLAKLDGFWVEEFYRRLAAQMDENKPTTAQQH